MKIQSACTSSAFYLVDAAVDTLVAREVVILAVSELAKAQSKTRFKLER